ncbi:cleft lip and palate transmembrane 1 [Xylona heveae TC161]|uniref:Cleft lip and palate transmembrane 1 n=1 Tax=Xylona heveae (strain CBS 132557 / TC161) TaxID=1328760 RepID=A0A165FUB7_XYLHT|nr:cleft lip and palate transmembrane 1 [Xylona heveae TC161]KZF21390.1 cleft lip and palate transmembrane 1 [Xylona heveae TC161]
MGTGSSPEASSSSSAPGAVAPSVIPAYDARPDALNADATYNPIPQNIAPIWPDGTPLDISIYVAPSLAMPPLEKMPPTSLVANEHAFKIGAGGDKREIHTSFPVPEEVQNNGTLWAHIYVAKTGHPLDPAAPNYDFSNAYHIVQPLNHYLAKKKVAKTRNLLSGSNATVEEESEQAKEESKSRPVLSYYHSNFTLSVVPNAGIMNYPTLHPAMQKYVHVVSSDARDASGQNSWYYPIFFLNTFWQLRDHMVELNSTVKQVPLHITLNNLKYWKFSLYSSLDEGLKQQQRQVASGGPIGPSGDGSEMEEFKRILIDTNVYLLSTTVVVSILHTIFEMLAFKSDISHWRNKKDNVGISFRSILANVFMQTVIFLYLVDNSDGTSWMILFGQGMGIVLEAWKITKTVDVRVRPAPAGSLIPYRISFEDKHKLSETEQKTKEYDEIAFKYLYRLAIPLLAAYAVYSLVYETHKSWYSFIITTLVGSVYAYGFLMMVPSLYINYRLKSVAHMPARAMTYKFLNTFIDDLFAFTIKMPILHRLATLRDDVIFFVYLYQAWKYKVDYTRVNEFGQGGDDEEEDKKEELPAKLASKPLTSPADGKVTEEVAAATSGSNVGGDSRKRK